MRRVVLLISMCWALVSAETPEARSILERSRTAFEKLKSFEIAAVTVMETSSADFEQTVKSKMMLAAEQQDKFRFESKGMGGLVKISDGSTTWTYNAFLKQYTKTTVRETMAHALTANPGAMLMPGAPDELKSARLIREEELMVDGSPRRCYVVEAEFEHKHPGPMKSEERPSIFWVDKSTYLILKRVSEQHASEWPPLGTAVAIKSSVTVESLKVNSPVAAELFTFEPPPEAKLVPEFEYPGMTKTELVGKQAPNFMLRDLSNKEVQLEQFRGKVVLLDFWATWCAPCRAQMPVLDKIHRDGDDVVVLGINVGEDLDQVQKFVEETKVTYPILLAGNGAIVKDYSVNAFPTAVIVDKSGRVRTHKSGYGSEGEQQLRAALNEARNPLHAAAASPAARDETAPGPKPAEHEGEPKTAEEAYRRAVHLMRARRVGDGIAMFRNAISLKPDWAEPYAARARAQFQEKRYNEAIKDLDEAIRIHPGNANWYNLRGLAYSYSGQHRRAIEDQNRAIEMNPKGSVASYSVASYNDRGWAYVELGQPEKALEDLNKAIQMAPDFQKAYENRAMAHVRLKEYARAITDLTAAMQLNPTPWQYQKRAEARRASGDAKGAEEDLRQAGEIGGPRPPLNQIR